VQPIEDVSRRDAPALPVAGIPSRGDNVALGVVVILVTNLALSLGDAAVKQISASFVLWQIFVIRSAIAIPVLILILRWRFPALSLVPRRIGWTAVRSLLLTMMWVAYYAALPHIPFGIAAATYYTLPIFITLFAALFLGDRIRLLGWAAVFLGFAGVLLILKPQAAGFSAYALLPLASALFYALAMILTRSKCRDEHPLILSFGLNVSFIAVGLLATAVNSLAPHPAAESTFLAGAWSQLGATAWLAMVLLATAVIVGSVGAAIAYQVGPPAIIAAFDFAYVGLAALWGIVFFGEVLDSVTIAGMALIVVAGILAIRR
jgi:drug/metabolite transporter (DMT)-like permease